MGQGIIPSMTTSFYYKWLVVTWYLLKLSIHPRSVFGLLNTSCAQTTIVLSFGAFILKFVSNNDGPSFTMDVRVLQTVNGSIIGLGCVVLLPSLWTLVSTRNHCGIR